jgi:preprotein translocase subunit SecE
MESQFQKWVNLSYLAVAAILAYIVFATGIRVGDLVNLEAHVRNSELIIRGVSVLAGLILFVVLYRNDRANQFMNEVMLELSRVTWPTQKETYSATFIVIVMILISSAALGFLDYVWTQLIQTILKG